MKMTQKKQVRSNIAYDYSKELETACFKNNLNSVQEILLSNQSNNHIKSQDFLDNALFICAQYSRLSIIKYLLESSDLKLHANIYSQKSRCIEILALRFNTEILEYLIFDYKIKRNSDINSEWVYYPKYDEMLKLRDDLESKNKMKRELEHHLPKNDAQPKKHKI